MDAEAGEFAVEAEGQQELVRLIDDRQIFELHIQILPAVCRAHCDPVEAGPLLLDADHELRCGIARESGACGAATVVLCASTGHSFAEWLIAWVGDCRVYRVRPTASDIAELLTRDDTYDHLGELPPPGGSPDDPARMVGNGAVIAPNVKEMELRDGEMLVLCSDGLHKYVDAREISGALQTRSPLSHACEELLGLVRLRGGDDDATLLIVHRKPRSRGRFAWMTLR